MVNGQPIFRHRLMVEMEKQVGKQTLDNIITQTLVLQEARRQNLTISQEEVDAEISKIEESLKAQGQDFNQLLQIQNLTREQVAEQIRLQKLVEKMAVNDVTVSDEEVATYIEGNKEFMPKEMKEDELKTAVREQLQQQKNNEKIQTWLDSLYKNAKIDHLLFEEADLTSQVVFG